MKADKKRHIKTFNVHYENEGRKSSCAFATTTADQARELVKQTFPRAIISKVEVLR